MLLLFWMAYRETTRGLSSVIPVTAGLMAYGRGAYYWLIKEGPCQ